jgi:hypothetical protein
MLGEIGAVSIFGGAAFTIDSLFRLCLQMQCCMWTINDLLVCTTLEIFVSHYAGANHKKARTGTGLFGRRVPWARCSVASRICGTRIKEAFETGIAFLVSTGWSLACFELIKENNTMPHILALSLLQRLDPVAISKRLPRVRPSSNKKKFRLRRVVADMEANSSPS